MTITAYPLAWPAGWKRGPGYKTGKFSTTRYSGGSAYRSKQEVTVAEGVRRVREQLDRMGLHDDDIVISTNLALRLDGLPRSDQREPDDSGAAVYWTDRAGATRCMAIDCYSRVADNLAAVAATLDAMRAIERHGGAEILDRAFTGFTALPPPAPAEWAAVLGVESHSPTLDVIAAYRTLRSQRHPDRGGDAGEFDQVEKAYAAFCAERGLP
jgi:hypothetical protein